MQPGFLRRDARMALDQGQLLVTTAAQMDAFLTRDASDSTLWRVKDLQTPE